MTSVYYNGNEYQKRTPLSEAEGFVLATAASAGIMSPLVYVSKMFQNQLAKEIPNNYLYKDCFQKSLNSLNDIGVEVIEAQHHNVPLEYKLGRQASYNPKTRQVILNTDKISAAGFHELGHALNSLKSKYGAKFLSKMRAPGYLIAGLMEYFAIFSRTKPKDAKRNFVDVIEDNCGKIAFAAMLPVVAEEGIASIRGIKLAKESGLEKHLIKNLKILYTKALATYAGRAALGGVAVYVSRKIMDTFTRPKLVEQSEFFNW